MARNRVSEEAQNALHSGENQDELEIARESEARSETNFEKEPCRLAAGQWLRVMTGFSAPFGHDGMPTVWG